MSEPQKDSQADESPEPQLTYQQQIELTAAGPLPMPSSFGGYEKVLPGAAERILRMAEKEQDHRLQQEQKILDAQIQDAKESRDIEKIGARHAIVFALTVVVIAAVLFYTDHTWGGGILGASSGLAGVVSALLRGRRNDNSIDNV